jgi:PIN domain nuclease of toxin-antitoxin system
VRLLLDTHLLLWAAASSGRLSSEARSLIEDPANDVHYSAASVWEIAIKSTLRRRDFRVDLHSCDRRFPSWG